MKKVIFISILILISTNVFAANIYLGPKAGCGVGIPFGGDYSPTKYDYDYVLNISGGVMLDLQIKRFGIYALGFQPEVLYNRTGYKFRNVEKKGNTVDFSHNAIEIPIYFKQKFRAGKGDIFFSLGVNFLFLIDYELKATRDYKSFDLSDFYTDIYTAGLTFALGYAIEFNSGNLEFAIVATPYFGSFANDGSVRQFKCAFEVSYAFKLL